MNLLNGKIIAAQIRASVRDKILHLPRIPGLAVILVGEDPASYLYVSLKERACEEVGINFEKYVFPSSATEEEILRKIEVLNLRQDINGILLQLPLPGQNASKLISAINPEKDVDGFHDENLKHLAADEQCLISPVVLGVTRLIDETRESFSGKKAILVMSGLFAQPFVAMLSRYDIASEIISPNDSDFVKKTKSGDILITALGKPNLITGEMIKPEAVVIDIGTTKVGKKTVGDIDFETISRVASWLTPVPGGVGPMTVAMLTRNVVEAFLLQDKPQA
jgi:methylenetetrahydrofolate dehydrogenase (NADP+)/methenyltetrahydrofolate cyclohydrolase